MNGGERTFLLKSEIFVNLSLHLDDVEFLQNAFIAQALVGPLVRFSNRGRYTPYVAKSWEASGNSWIFDLHPGLTCEDGQPITPQAFKASLARSLRRFSEEEISEMPFGALEGISEWIRNKDNSKLGITASESKLTLRFTKPVGKALLEYLAMTPFAFLCDANFEGDKWRSKDQFISSGPYRVTAFDSAANRCTLALRKDWSLAPANAFAKVYLTEFDADQIKPTAKAEMTYGKLLTDSSPGGSVLEVPRALMSIRVGLERDQYFFERKNRQVLQAAVNAILDRAEIPFKNYHRAESFFFGQVSGHERLDQTPPSVAPPSEPLKIRGLPKGARPEADFYQGLLFRALDQLGWKYELTSNPIKGVKDFYNLSYDLAFDRSHVDATLDPDLVRLLFKSKLGPRYQDPGGRVAHLVDDFDKGALNYRDFLISFNSILAEEAAILPLYHRGFVWTFSPEIDVKSLSPLMSILRYEELVLKPDESN